MGSVPMATDRPDPRRRGFILLETLVALAVLGLALGAMLPRVVLAGRLAAQAAQTEAAVALADSLLAGLSGLVLPAATGQGDQVSQGRGADGRPWRLVLCCAPPRPSGAGPALVTVRLTVGLRPEGHLTVGGREAGPALTLETRRMLPVETGP